MSDAEYAKGAAAGRSRFGHRQALSGEPQVLGLTGAQRDALAQLEAVKRPTPYAKGTLAALRRTASGEDAERVARLDQKWGA